ncbi:MAG: hypothetical protein ABJG41_13185 [Cyclobacteriaceae bacterium]
MKTKKQINAMTLTTVVKIPVDLDFTQPDNPMMANSDKTPTKNPNTPMILGVFNWLWTTSLGKPSVVAIKIFVIAKTAVRNPEEEVVASLNMTL